MEQFFLVSCFFTTAVIAIAVATGYLRGTRDLITMRNIFLLGIAQFYSVAGLFTVWYHSASETYRYTDHSLWVLALLMPLFAFAFIGFYAVCERWRWPGRLFPKMEFPTTLTALVVSVCVLDAFALATLELPQVYVVFLVGQARIVYATVGAGLAAYIVISRPYNPLSWAIFIPALAFAVLISTVAGNDRRYLISAFGVVPWMWYYYSLRYRRVGPSMVKLIAIGVVVLLATAAYTGVRHQVGGMKDATFSARTAQFKSLANAPRISQGSWAIMFYQDTPVNTMYILDYWPSQYEVMPFYGAWWVITNPIPRYLWAGKPIGMGSILQEQLQTPANLGVGIIGSGWSEMLVAGVLYYAAFFGLFCSALDRLTRDRIQNPYVVATIGANLGNAFGLPRGETSLMMLLIVVGLVFVPLVLWFTNLFLGPLLRIGVPIVLRTPGTANALPLEGDDPGSDGPASAEGLYAASAYGVAGGPDAA